MSQDSHRSNIVGFEEKRLYRVVNTHLDHEGSQVREQGLLQIMERLLNPVNFPEAMLLLAGNFHAEPDMPELEFIKRYPQFRDASASAGSAFHDYGRLTEGEKEEALCELRQ